MEGRDDGREGDDFSMFVYSESHNNDPPRSKCADKANPPPRAAE